MSEAGGLRGNVVSKKVENTIPVLPVKDLKRSKEFYVQKLGFVVDWGESEDAEICQVSRDGCPIMLTEDRSLGSPACVWVGLESDELFRELMDKGVTVLQEPSSKPWAYEMLVHDVDGNVLWLGTAPKS
jgi:predicted lactoylglutathione lyase